MIRARHTALAGSTALAFCWALAPMAAHAQQLPYADVSADGLHTASGDASLGGGDSPDEADGKSRGRKGHERQGSNGARTKIQPYLEIDQSVFANFKSPHDVLTYTTVAAGVDASITGRNTEGSVSVRYERRISESRSRLRDSDTVSGIARVRHDLVPHTLSIEAGGLAARTRVEAGGNATLNPQVSGDAVSQIYSLYAGPALSTHVGRAAVNGSYLVGYTKVGSPGATVLAPGQTRADVFDHSISHAANLSLATKAGEGLPVGLGANVGANREDISNLDQRVEDYHAEAVVAVPLSYDLQVQGGVGYEKVKVSSRDAVRDANGNPVIGTDGRYQTDKSAPRQLAYDTSGLIWDVGVIWKPSRRTSLTASVGRRYGGMIYQGSFNFAPDARQVFNVSVYEGLTGFGGQLTNALSQLPTDISVTRNPFNGSLSGCALGGGNGGSASGGCLNNALSSVNSAAFRSRGVNATYGHRVGRYQLGVGAGYSRRKFIAAPGTVLGQANGTADENYFVDTSFSGPIDRSTRFSTLVYADWFTSGQSSLGDTRVIGANAALNKQITDRLTGNFALGVDGIDRKVLDDSWVGQALVGLRYNF